jgi:hypothetical protein
MYDMVKEVHGPLILHGATRMLEAFRAEVAERPDARIAFVGRDGHSLALAVYELDREFFEDHCTEITVSRCLADSAVQDLEINSGRGFPELEAFRAARDQVDPNDIPGTRARMTNYLEDRGVPVGTPGSRIILADTSYKGTVQELLAAQYPDVEFRGHYLFLAESPQDPHPGSKTGHVLHVPPDGTPSADDPAAVFTQKDAVLAIEHVLRGARSKAVRFGTDGIPEQRREAPSRSGIDPADLAPEYRDDNVRIAAMEVAQLAIAQHARQATGQRGPQWRAELAAESDTSARRVGSWARRDGATDPAQRTVLDSFVRRSDRPAVDETQTHVRDFPRWTDLSEGADHG